MDTAGHQPKIRRLATAGEAKLCAQAMTKSEPWVSLKRDFDESLSVLTDPAKEIYVAELDQRLVGFIILDMKGPFVGYIKTVCVFPEWRDYGLGSQLIAFAEERIFRESPNVFMCVSSFNNRAFELYQRLGYEKIGVLKNFIVSGHSEFLLRKTIGPLRDFARKSSTIE
jgi:ribosomal-protein-alanine N-acetyltransferase